jgi:hypothetical protein
MLAHHYSARASPFIGSITSNEALITPPLSPSASLATFYMAAVSPVPTTAMTLISPHKIGKPYWLAHAAQKFPGSNGEERNDD